MPNKKLDYLMMSEEEKRAYDGYLAYLGQELDILDSAKEERSIEIAKEMIKRKMDINTVSEITKLTPETIRKLAKELENM